MNSTSTTSILSMFLVVLLMSCTDQNKNPESNISKTEIRETEEGYRIFVDGAPFYVRGAGVNEGSIEALANHGANAMRTWHTGDAERVLDEAQSKGLKVMMGIWVALERHNFDYNDESAVQKQLEEIRKDVKRLKDHPALIAWGIGNELNHESHNPKVWDAVNDISKMIHEEDPNHLTTTSLAGLDKKYVDYIAERAPDLDFISIQVYGSIEVLPELIANSGYKGPILVTEWGATGYWEVPKTEWGAPLENHSSVKADSYKRRYEKSILSQNQVMGSFVFLWGQKQERTPTWFGMFTADGQETESVDVMHYFWNGDWPQNRTPRLNDFTIEGQKAEDNVELTIGNSYSAIVDVSDPDNDPMTYRWEIMEESTSNKTGGDKEIVPSAIEGLFTSIESKNATFNTPSKPGPYRLFVYIEDGNRHVAHANIPFLVK